MNTMWIPKVLVVVFVFSGGFAHNFSELNIVERTLKECNNLNESFSCISDQVARAVERTIDWDVPLIEGVTLVRNKEKIVHRQGRLFKGVDRLKKAVLIFFDTHMISLDLGGARKLSSDGKAGNNLGGFGGGYSGGLINRKQIAREKKYMQYAFMVLLGIFGLTGPMFMKILGLMAAKALLSAKAALIIVGSVALKKLFQKDHHEPNVKVHTIPISHDFHDEYDRTSKNGYFGYSHGAGQYYQSPYVGYYDDNYSSSSAKEHFKVNNK